MTNRPVTWLTGLVLELSCRNAIFLVQPLGSVWLKEISMPSPGKKKNDGIADVILATRMLQKQNMISLSKKLKAVSDKISKEQNIVTHQWRQSLGMYLQINYGIDLGRALSFSDYHMSILFAGEIQAISKGKVSPEKDSDHEHRANLEILCECYGDELGKIYYKDDIYGREALVARVVEKFGLNPGEATALSSQSLVFMLKSEIQDIKLSSKLDPLLALSAETQARLDEGLKQFSSTAVKKTIKRRVPPRE